MTLSVRWPTPSAAQRAAPSSKSSPALSVPWCSSAPPTGKGVVIDAAARAERGAAQDARDRGRCIRLNGAPGHGQPRPRRTDTHPGLAGRPGKHGTVHVGQNTTVFLDEAGMVDHKRLMP